MRSRSDGHNVVLVVRPDTRRRRATRSSSTALAPLLRLTVFEIPGHGSHRRRRLQFLKAAYTIQQESQGRRRLHARPRPGGVLSVVCRVPTGPGWSTSRTASRRSSAPRCRSCSATAASGPQPTKLRRLDRRERLVWTRADAYVTITRALADESDGSLRRARLGVRRPRWRPCGRRRCSPTTAGRSTTARWPAYAGHLYPWKGVDVFVRALGARARRSRIDRRRSSGRARSRAHRAARARGRRLRSARDHRAPGPDATWRALCRKRRCSSCPTRHRRSPSGSRRR